MPRPIKNVESWTKQTSRLFLVAFLVSLATPAWSQSNDTEISEMLLRSDLNRDGQVTRKELEKSRSKTFERLDRTQDRVVNKKDRPPHPFNKRFDEAFARLAQEFDANEDGEVTRKEFVQGPTTAFDAADLDGDNVLSEDEIATLTIPGG